MWDPSWDPTETNGKYGGIPVGSPVGSPGIPCIPEPFAWPLDGIPQNRLFTRDPGTGRLTYIILPVNDQGACRGIPRLGSPIVRGLGGVALGGWRAPTGAADIYWELRGMST